MQLEEKWYIENGEVFDTNEIFSKLVANKLNRNLNCWNSNNQKELISKRFWIMNNKYGLLDYLGEGTFGTVYLGFNITEKQSQKRLVAIKQPTSKLLHNYAQLMGYVNSSQETTVKEQAIQRAKFELGQKFSQEALLMGRLSACENVVSIIDHDIRIPYIVLEYCNAGSLRNRVETDYTDEDIESWARQIAKALDAAHSLKPDMLIHRDLKPDNILIDNKVLKISDFGTSTMKQQSESLNSLHGGYTPRYAAPEAFAGKAYPQTDIWSLGIILYELITKESPFAGKNMPELIQNILTTKPRNIEDVAKYRVSPKLKKLVMRSLEKEISNRPQANEYLQKEVNLPKEKNFTKKTKTEDQECFSAINIQNNNLQNEIKKHIQFFKPTKTNEENKSRTHKKEIEYQEKFYSKMFRSYILFIDKKIVSPFRKWRLPLPNFLQRIFAIMGKIKIATLIFLIILSIIILLILLIFLALR